MNAPEPYRQSFLNGRVSILVGDVRAMLGTLPDDHFDCVVTSPPYWGLRDYGVTGQIGLEPTLGEHLDVMVSVFREVRRVLKPTGTLWLNYGDCYATSPNGRSAADTKAAGKDDQMFRDKPFSTIGGYLKAKDLCMVPNRLAIALQEAGWWVRSEIIWGKRNGMPDSSGKYRPSTAHEKIFLLSKTANCFYDANAVALPCSSTTHARVSQDVANQIGSNRANGGAKTNGNMKAVTRKSWKGSRFDGDRDRRRHPDIGRNRAFPGAGSLDAALTVMPETRYLRNYEAAASLTVWPMATTAFSEAHFATFPPELVERCLKAGCPTDGEVLDPFGGSGTTALVATTLGRKATLIELNPGYVVLARARIEAAFMSKEAGSRHIAKQLGKDKAPFEVGTLFAHLASDGDVNRSLPSGEIEPAVTSACAPSDHPGPESVPFGFNAGAATPGRELLIELPAFLANSGSPMDRSDSTTVIGKHGATSAAVHDDARSLQDPDNLTGGRASTSSDDFPDIPECLDRRKRSAT